MNTLIIGAGNMGKAFIESFIQKNFLQPNQITVVEKHKAQQDAIRQLGITNVYSELGSFVSEQNIIILATKPQDAATVLNEIKKQVHQQQLFLSIMAGVSIETISNVIHSDRIVRCMPNLPCQLGLGVTGFFANSSISDTEVKYISDLLSCTGFCIQLKDENQLHSITAISGSGPAYIFYFMQAMIEQAIHFGYTEKEATKLVAHTFKGAVALLENNSFTCEQWINKVASKGGTTEAAIQTFENHNVKTDIQQGMLSALERSIEMGKYK